MFFWKTANGKWYSIDFVQLVLLAALTLSLYAGFRWVASWEF